MQGAVHAGRQPERGGSLSTSAENIHLVRVMAGFDQSGIKTQQMFVNLSHVEWVAENDGGFLIVKMPDMRLFVFGSDKEKLTAYLQRFVGYAS